MLPPEVIKEHGHVNDWKRVVGTGPYQLTEWVDGSSVTWNKISDYWGFDEKFPENRLPYIDEIRALVIRDEATRLSALRTGKIDFVGHGAISNIQSFDTAKKLQETNPELIMYPWYFRSNFAYSFNLKGARYAKEMDQSSPGMTSGCARPCRWPWTWKPLTRPF
jgi:peptide/nickel transport system substrate-binding protein